MKADESKIASEWALFSHTDAYKDWVKAMEDTMKLIQTNVDNMTETKTTPQGTVTTNLDSERCALLNQRKVGIAYAMQYIKLRLDKNLT